MASNVTGLGVFQMWLLIIIVLVAFVEAQSVSRYYSKAVSTCDPNAACNPFNPSSFPRVTFRAPTLSCDPNCQSSWNGGQKWDDGFNNVDPIKVDLANAGSGPDANSTWVKAHDFQIAPFFAIPFPNATITGMMLNLKLQGRCVLASCFGSCFSYPSAVKIRS